MGEEQFPSIFPLEGQQQNWKWSKHSSHTTRKYSSNIKCKYCTVVTSKFKNTWLPVENIYKSKKGPIKVCKNQTKTILRKARSLKGKEGTPLSHTSHAFP